MPAGSHTPLVIARDRVSVNDSHGSCTEYKAEQILDKYPTNYKGCFRNISDYIEY